MSQARIAIIDYGAGNVKSIRNAFGRLGIENVSLAKTDEDLKKVDAVVLPGVGAFANCIENLKNSQLLPRLEELVFEESTPILGICVGMQLFFDSSTEDGNHSGLGWLHGSVKVINPPSDFKVPHVGWNQLSIINRTGLFAKSYNCANFYFDHSYAVSCDTESKSSTTFHGVDIVASIERKNIYGVQFHPEKSGNSGLRILRAFVEQV